MYTVKRVIGSDVVGMASELNDALVFLQPSNKEPEGTYYVEDLHLLDRVDEHVYSYKGYSLVNELYEDDERFFKNHYMYGKEVGEGKYVYQLKTLDGLSSNSYAKYNEAIDVFKKKIDFMQNNG